MAATSDVRCQLPGKDQEGGGGEESERDAGGGLTDDQRELLERCLQALRHTKNDSQTLAALLLVRIHSVAIRPKTSNTHLHAYTANSCFFVQITRVCPASQLDKPTLRRIFEAVGLNLPARLLVTAVRGSDSSSLPSHELLSLGTALLSALSTDPDMASHPQLLATIPLLLEILASGAVNQEKPTADGQSPESQGHSSEVSNPPCNDDPPKTERSSQAGDGVSTPCDTSPSSKLDEAVAADCYQVLAAVCASPSGPDQLLSRGAVPALCHAVEQNQTSSRTRGLPLLGCLLSGKTKDKAWKKHAAELWPVVVKLSKDLAQSTDQTRLDMCSQLAPFLPPVGVPVPQEELKEVVSGLWEVLRPMMQAKLTARQLGPVLVLSACLLDLYGWELAGPPKVCCLLVHRACVEVRMGLEEPPGNELTPELRETITGTDVGAVPSACTRGRTSTVDALKMCVGLHE